MTAILLALASSISWGTADFLAGLRARRLPILAVMLLSEIAGLIGVVGWIAIGGVGAPAAARLAPALVAGLAGTLALAAFYRALAIGTMSIVAPLSALGAVVPVIAGLAGGDRPSGAQLAGMAIVLAGVVLVSRAGDAGTVETRRSIVLAVGSAIGFGTFLWLMAPAAAASVPWALLVARAGAIVAVATVVLARRVELRTALDPPVLASLVVVGALDLTANALYAVATTKGLLAVVAVLGDLYPVSTIVLARVLLGERVRRGQEAGILAVLGGVALIAAA